MVAGSSSISAAEPGEGADRVRGPLPNSPHPISIPTPGPTPRSQPQHPSLTSAWSRLRTPPSPQTPPIFRHSLTTRCPRTPLKAPRFRPTPLVAHPSSFPLRSLWPQVPPSLPHYLRVPRIPAGPGSPEGPWSPLRREVGVHKNPPREHPLPQPPDGLGDTRNPSPVASTCPGGARTQRTSTLRSLNGPAPGPS